MYTLFYETLPSCSLIHNIKLLGGDTDSFFLQLTVDQDTTASDVLSSMKRFVDFSNYPSSHPLYSIDNKAKLGCFKDELQGCEIEEMILLKPKMYSIKIKENEEGGEKTIKRAKGIGKAAVKNLRHKAYQEAYYQHKESLVEMTILKSTSHTVQTHTFRKRGLSCWEDKRVWVNANFSLPHGNIHSPVTKRSLTHHLVPPSGDVEECMSIDENVSCEGEQKLTRKREQSLNDVEDFSNLRKRCRLK